MDYRKMNGLDAWPSLLGFGCMRFPTDGGGNIDEGAAADMLHRAYHSGVNYFDTAWPYHDGKSEAFVGKTLSCYPRDSYYLATKLPGWLIHSAEDARNLFEEQLRRLQTDYVDFYLLHSLSRKAWRRLVDLGVVELCEQLQREGRIRWFGFSFHDDYDAFEEILDARIWDFCQIQLNYMDADYQAGMAGYALAERKGVPVLVMEPVKGGTLARLPGEVSAPLRALNDHRSDAGWALAWVASLPNVKVVLSGMSNMEQLLDNLDLFDHFTPFREEEWMAVYHAAETLRARVRNGCTGCAYCMPCPKGVDIPRVFRMWNTMGMYANRDMSRSAWEHLDGGAGPWACVGCGACMDKCPQHLPIPGDLAKARWELNEFTGYGR